MSPNRNRCSAILLAVFASPALLAAQVQPPAPSQNQASNPTLIQAQNPNPGVDPEGRRVFRFDSNQVSPEIGASTSTIYAFPAPASTDCPVSMHAQHRSFPALRMTRDSHFLAPTEQGPAQHIHLSLGVAREPVQLAAATVTVRGTGAQWRTVPAAQSTNASPYLKKTFHLVFRPIPALEADEEAAASDLRLDGFTSVQSVTLDSLSYADGSLWTPAPGRTCRTVPDLLMLVDSR